MTNSSKKKIFLSLVLAVLVLVIFSIPSHPARAANLWTLVTDPVGWGIEKIGEFINTILTAVLTFFAWLLSLAGLLFDFFFTFEQYSTAPLVKVGWKLVRDFTNMFFAFILLIISFATILGRETYGIKALLPKLIIAALLINFSLVICGVIIDFSQVFLHYFVDGAKGTGTKGISVQIASNLSVTDIAVKTALSKGIGGGNVFATGAKVITTIYITMINLILSIVLLLLATFVFLAGFCLLFYRMIALWMMMIGAPIIWLGNILPFTAKYCGQWWENFIKQCLVGPIFFFFIFLTMRFIQIGGVQDMATQAANSPYFVGGFGEIIKFVMQYIVILSIMSAGLIVAPSLGGKGTQVFANLIGKGKQMATGWAKTAGLAGATGVGAAAVSSKWGQKASDWMARKGGVIGRQLSAPMRRISEAQQQTKGKEITALAEKSKHITSDNLKKDIMADKDRGNTKGMIAKSTILAGRGHLTEDTKYGFTDDIIKKTMQATEKIDPKLANQMCLGRLDLADALGKDIKEILKQAKPADMERIRKEDLDPTTGPAALKALQAIENHLADNTWKVGHLEQLSRENAPAAEIVRNEIIFGPGRQAPAARTLAWLNSNAGQAFYG